MSKLECKKCGNKEKFYGIIIGIDTYDNGGNSLGKAATELTPFDNDFYCEECSELVDGKNEEPIHIEVIDKFWD